LALDPTMVKAALGACSARRASTPDDSTAAPGSASAMNRIGKRPAMPGCIAARADFAAPPLSAYIASMTVKLARLSGRALIRVAGPDARPFLHNLLSQNVETLQPGEWRFGALLAPQGRLLFDLFIIGEPDGVLLDVAADRRDALLARMALYELDAAVTIEPIEDAVWAAWDGPAEGFAPDPRLPALGGRAWGGEHETNAAQTEYDAWRLSLGVPDPARDVVADKTFPIEAN